MENYRREPRENEQEIARERGRGRNSELREDLGEILTGVRLIRAGLENFLYGNRREGARQIRTGLDEIEDGVGDIIEDLR